MTEAEHPAAPTAWARSRAFGESRSALRRRPFLRRVVAEVDERAASATDPAEPSAGSSEPAGTRPEAAAGASSDDRW